MMVEKPCTVAADFCIMTLNKFQHFKLCASRKFIPLLNVAVPFLEQ